MKKLGQVIGIDVGGTNIKFGIVSRTGKISNQFSLPTYAHQNPKKVLEQIVFGVNKILETKSLDQFAGIGIGIPGKVDIKNGIVTSAPNFMEWERVNVRRAIYKKFKTRIELDNDANCAALGELHFGIGRKIKSFIMITLGTGVGGGIIINGKLIRGESGGAGEIGHVSIDFQGPLCKCGQHGCIEAYAGNNYIIKRTIQKLQEYPDSKIVDLVENNLDKIEPKTIFKASIEGDELANKILFDTGYYLGIGLASVMNILDLKTFVIGGGISAAGSTLLRSIESSLKKHGIKEIVKDVKVYPARLKNKAGILGAASLLFD
jgi:glucokinase